METSFKRNEWAKCTAKALMFRATMITDFNGNYAFKTRVSVSLKKKNHIKSQNTYLYVFYHMMGNKEDNSIQN